MNAFFCHPARNRYAAGLATLAAAPRPASHALSLLVAAAALMSAAASARADSLNFNAIGASSIDIGNNGVFDTIETGPLAYGTGRDSQGRERRWAIEFNLAALPVGAVIDSASLTLRTASPAAVGQVALNGYAGDGSITVGDMVAGAVVLTFTPATFLPVAYDVTSFVQGTYSPAQNWLGFNLRQTPLEAIGSGMGDLWNGPENFPSPFLTVNYTLAPVPEPAAALLMALGLVSVLLAEGHRRPAPRSARQG